MKRGISNAMNRLGIEVLSVFGMPPLAFVELAADLGCRHISLGLEPMPENPHGYPRWSLRDDPALRRAAADLALMAELGVRCVNAVTIDPDLTRNQDQYGAFAELAAAAGMAASIEFMPGLPIGNLAAAGAWQRRTAARRHPEQPAARCGGESGGTDAGQGLGGYRPEGAAATLCQRRAPLARAADLIPLSK